MSKNYLVWISIGFLVAILSFCNRPPAADFYEADGIISVQAASVDPTEEWQIETSGVTSSIVSKPSVESSAGETSFTFYIGRTGNYVLWLLGNSDSENNHPLQLRFQDERDETLSLHRIELISGEIPQWVHLDQITEEPVVLNADKEGFYTLKLESGGLPGLQVSKLHLSLNGEVIPRGAGFPETIDWRMEPVMDKRLIQRPIPSSHAFDLISSSEDLEKLSHLSERNGSPNSANELLDLQNRDNVLTWYQPRENIDETYLRRAIQLLADSKLVTYESSWLFIPPIWFGLENTSGDQFTKENWIRYLQLATFQNIMFFPKPQMQSLPEEFLNKLDRFTDLRRKLFPYIYSYVHRARTIGEKFITEVPESNSQFLFGDALMIKPFIKEGEKDRAVWLPDGIWYSFDLENRFKGGQEVTADFTLNEIPAFIKAGSIIPMRPEPVLPSEGDNSKLVLQVYGGDSGTFRLYEDDGKSMKYQSGEFSTVALRYFEGDGYATFNIGAQVNDIPGRREHTEYEIQFKFVDKPTRITANGDEMQDGNETWNYVSEQKLLILNWRQNDKERTEFRIEY